MANDQAPPPPPRWVLDLKFPPQGGSKQNSAIADPPGYTPRQQSRSSKSAQPARKAPTSEEMETLKMKKAWEVAIAPAKQLPMNGIGMYMSGSSLQIFSIMMVFMIFKTPVTAIMNIQRVFAPYETPNNSAKLIPVKLVYILTNCAFFALGIWKVNQMGLLPNTRSDWLTWEAPRTVLERAVPAFDT